MRIPEEPTTAADQWSDWLLHRRFGGDYTYRPVFQRLVEEIRDRVLSGARLTSGLTMLDVGAGDGLIAFGALQQVAPPFDVIVSDISAHLLAHAERISVELGFRERCTFVETSADDPAGIGDESVDVLTCRAVLAYVADKKSAVRNFLRVLRPGGRLSIGEPINQDAAVQLAALTNLLQCEPKNSTTPYLKLLQRLRANQLPSDLQGIRSKPVTEFSERDLVQLFRAAGFANIHMELHIDVKPSPSMSWSTFIDIAPLPGTPSLREVFDQNFVAAEIALFESHMRPDVESGKMITQTTIAYLTAEKR